MTFDLISGLHMQIQTWHPPLWLCTHAEYHVKSGLTNVLKNANKTKNMHLFGTRDLFNISYSRELYLFSKFLHFEEIVRVKMTVCFEMIVSGT